MHCNIVLDVLTKMIKLVTNFTFNRESMLEMQNELAYECGDNFLEFMNEKARARARSRQIIFYGDLERASDMFQADKDCECIIVQMTQWIYAGRENKLYSKQKEITFEQV